MSNNENTIICYKEKELLAALREHGELRTTTGVIFSVNGAPMYKIGSRAARPLTLADWYHRTLTIPHETKPTEEHTGGSSSYYDVTINGQTVSCLDIIEALNMDFVLGNIFKAAWRIAAARNGKNKKGNNEVYDAEKIVFFGERLLKKKALD